MGTPILTPNSLHDKVASPEDSLCAVVGNQMFHERQVKTILKRCLIVNGP